MCGDTEINSSNLRAALNKLNKQSGRDQTTNMATQFKVMLYTITEETPNNGTQHFVLCSYPERLSSLESVYTYKRILSKLRDLSSFRVTFIKGSAVITRFTYNKFNDIITSECKKFLRNKNVK